MECRCQMCGCLIDAGNCVLGKCRHGDLCDACNEAIEEELIEEITK